MRGSGVRIPSAAPLKSTPCRHSLSERTGNTFRLGPNLDPFSSLDAGAGNRAMNIRRGLVRAWLVLSLCWVAWVGFINYGLYASFVEAQLWPERIEKDQDRVLANMA